VTSTVLDAARTAYMAGICVVPPKEDGTKMPLARWTRWQAERPTGDQMKAWYGPGGDRSGIGFVCGAVSGNLELFEFDDRETYERFREAAEGVGLDDVTERIEDGYLEETPGGGVHWFYRCDEIAGNTKLARRPGPGPDEVTVLIETRGEGGYAVVAPSNGNVHPSHGAYRLLSGGPDRIATIAPAERAELWRLARSFDEMPRAAFRIAEPADTDWSTRPGDDFAAGTDWGQILTPHGWEAVFAAGDETYWRRPGKDRGWSATTNYRGSDLLYVFSTSVAGFASERGYGKFGAYAVLEHGGDFTRAAAALAERGYGTRKTTPETPASPATPAYHLTDLGNAHRLAARHGRDVRWCDPMGRWLHWNGVRWEQVGQTILVDLAKETALSIYDEARAAPDGSEYQTALQKWAKASGSGRAIAAMVNLTKTVTGELAVDADQLDADPMLLGVENGVVDLRTGRWRAAERSDLITKSCRAPFDGAATCPLWEAFLARIFAGDAEVIAYVQRAAGYSLTGKTSERVIFIGHGSGTNGKTTFLEVLAHVLGTYAMSTPVETLMARKDPGIPNDLARIKSARFVSATETERGSKLAEARIKAVTGGDRMTARFLHQEFFDFIPQCKLWFATNHRPEIASGGKAIWKRVRLLPFEVEIPEDEIDPDLKAKLLAEAPGILGWMVRGCLAWQAKGLREPASIRTANRAYEEDEDVLGAFLEDRAIVQPNVWCSVADLYAAFHDWAKAHGEELLSAKAFSQAMSERKGIKRQRQGNATGTRGFLGVRLPAPVQPKSKRTRQEDGLDD
jgi:putative DNA primase/helicase